MRTQGWGAASSYIIKKILHWAILPLVLISCSGEDEDDEIIGSAEYLNVTSAISLTGDGTTSATLEIKADCSWIISGAPSWLTLSDKSGEGNTIVTLSATPNPSSTTERSADLTVASTNGKIKRIVTVSQSLAEEELILNVNEMVFDCEIETKTLSIQSNGNWEIIGEEDWINLPMTKGSGNADISITTIQNFSESNRSLVLTIQGGNKSQQVRIEQKGIKTTLTITPTSASFPSLGGTLEIEVSGDAEWTAFSTEPWCILDKTTGKGGATIIVSCKENSSSERTSNIIITSAQHRLICEILQYSPSVPQLSKVVVTNIKETSFDVYATYDSTYDIDECGFVYSSNNPTPTLNDFSIRLSINDPRSGSIKTTVSGMNVGHKYYIRAYARNKIGIGYGDAIHVTTEGSKPGNNDNPLPNK